jgi:lipid-binding SYLF domain-containing protein
VASLLEPRLQGVVIVERREDMLGRARVLPTVASLAAALCIIMTATRAHADSAEQIDGAVDAALPQLYQNQPSAQMLAQNAKAILVFPTIVKAGFMFGAAYGEGALRQNGASVGYYSSVAASYGYQVGLQEFGYAMFFMTDTSLQYLNQSDGFEVGVGPSVVVVDQGMGKSLTSTTLTQDVYAYIFDQQGLFAGAGIQGSKITKINR